MSLFICHHVFTNPDFLFFCVKHDFCFIFRSYSTIFQASKNKKYNKRQKNSSMHYINLMNNRPTFKSRLFDYNAHLHSTFK